VNCGRDTLGVSRGWLITRCVKQTSLVLVLMETYHMKLLDLARKEGKSVGVSKRLRITSWRTVPGGLARRGTIHHWRCSPVFCNRL
jgi:hypothetical protein